MALLTDTPLVTPATLAEREEPRSGAHGLLRGILSVPLLWKLAGANLLIALAAVLGVAAERRFNLPGNAVSVLGFALAASLVVNFLLVYIALRPLSDLEAAAAHVSAGDLAARVPPSMLADRNMARVGSTLNTLLDRLTRDRARLRRLAAQVISAQDEERARVARELHDSTAQTLTAVMLQLGAAAHESSSSEMDESFATMRELVADALEEVRSLSHTMHPRVLDDLGLAAALEWLARQTRTQEPFDVQVIAEDDGSQIPAPLASVLYRVAQEALRNAAHHAEARHVELKLRRDADTATLEVVDDGRGFDVKRAEERRPGMGLFSMRERVALVNGRFSITSTPGRGTRVVATIPLANWNPDES
jgi:signal transduction histidine kinase